MGMGGNGNIKSHSRSSLYCRKPHCLEWYNIVLRTHLPTPAVLYLIGPTYRCVFREINDDEATGDDDDDDENCRLD